MGWKFQECLKWIEGKSAASYRNYSAQISSTKPDFISVSQPANEHVSWFKKERRKESEEKKRKKKHENAFENTEKKWNLKSDLSLLPGKQI